jgi:hypothetical protein
MLLVLATVAGCDKLFAIDHLDPPIDGRPRDGAIDTRMTDGAPDMIIQTHSSCPPGFGLPYENSTYSYYTASLTWSDAMQFCRNLDDPTSTRRVHLPVLSSDFERSIHVYVMVVGSASAYWIGLSDTQTEGTLQWVTAEQVSYPYPGAWGPNEPSMDPGDECVRVEASNNNLDVIPCTTMSPFVCECDDYALEPANYTLM